MNIAKIEAQPELSKITVTIHVPKLTTLRIRVGVWLMGAAVRICGCNLKTTVDGIAT